jgi:S-(hydroxymethyl)glutathione dehydrogenase/alcohol dehydrogenase
MNRLAGESNSRGSTMKMNATVLWEIGQEWCVEEVDLDPPAEGEVLVSFTASGLCHSDHHIRAGDLPGFPLPVVGGHEGSGVVEEVGPGTRDLKVGDHVVTSFLPACGRCRWCAAGRQNLCDMGALIMTGTQVDGTYRRHARGRDIGVMSVLGTFAQYGTVAEQS